MTDMVEKMELPRFVQIHILNSFTGALLNRDENGLSKKMVFGGTERLRFSSQCYKKHVRDEFRVTLANCPEPFDMSRRSRHIFSELIFRPLTEEGYDPEQVALYTALLRDRVVKGEKGEPAAEPDPDVEGKGKKKKKGKGCEDPASKLVTGGVLTFGNPEIEKMKGIVRSILEAPEKERDALLERTFSDFRVKGKGLTSGLDAALFGRMLSGDPDARMDASVYVAHSFSVSAEECEPDYLTAVDELGKSTGSGFIGETEITSGRYYSYLVINIPQLVANVENVSLDAWQKPELRENAARIVKLFLETLSRTTPGAKLGSTAPFSVPEMILVETGSKQNRSLAGAFERALPSSVGLDGAFKALRSHMERFDGMYGVSGSRFVSALEDPRLPLTERIPFDVLTERVAASVRGTKERSSGE